MDVSDHLELLPAPQVLFRYLEQRRHRPRFMVPRPGGDYAAVTWGGFCRDIECVGALLAGEGLRRGDRAAIFAANSVPWMVAAMAIGASCGVMVPIYPASTADQAAYIVGHSDARFVFVAGPDLLRRVFERWHDYAGVERIVILDDTDPDAVLGAMRDEGVPTVDPAAVHGKLRSWSRVLAAGAQRCAADPNAFSATLAGVDLDDGALMLYTSGTTGRPKGVPLTHRNLAVNARDWMKVNAPLIDDNPVDVLWLPMSHIFGYGETCLGNTLGFVSYLGTPATLLEQLPVVQPNVLMSVPSYWEKIAAKALVADDPSERRERLRRVTGGQLRFCLSGGAGLGLAVKELFYSCGILLVEGYGLTECAPTLTINRTDAFRFDSVGKPLPHVQLRLADDGEILAKGPNIFAGYHKDPDATAAAFTADGWFKTGDIGKLTDDGFLQIVDRKKEILVTAGGKNVPPANIETRFAGDPLFRHVVVYGDGRKYLVAGLWLDQEAVDERLSQRRSDAPPRDVLSASIDAAVQRVNAGLARFEQIKKYRVMDTPLTVAGGLLTSTLKVRRKRVYAEFEAEFEALYRS